MLGLPISVPGNMWLVGSGLVISGLLAGGSLGVHPALFCLSCYRLRCSEIGDDFLVAFTGLSWAYCDVQAVTPPLHEYNGSRLVMVWWFFVFWLLFFLFCFGSFCLKTNWPITCLTKVFNFFTAMTLKVVDFQEFRLVWCWFLWLVGFVPFVFCFLLPQLLAWQFIVAVKWL